MKRSIFIFSLLIFTLPSAAQNFESLLFSYNKAYPQEKIYIHYDKDFYAAGETIWYKGYFFNNGRPSILSSNFYIQLINSYGTVVDHKLYAIGGATIKGNIDLPDSLPSGNYYIRGATPLMVQNDESFVYYKKLYISNQSTKPTHTNLPSPPVSIKFFPESGNLVAGILSVVAFKATDAKGKPVDVSGIIKSEDGIDIPFKSVHDGIGKTQWRIKAGQNYYAEIKHEGQNLRFALPKVQASGLNLRVENEKGGKMFELTRSEVEKDRLNTVTLVVQLNNNVVYNNTISFDDYPSIRGHLLTDSLSSGVLHFTVFNDKMVPVAERLSFVNNEEYKSAGTVDIIRSSMDKRSENKLNLTFSQPAQRSLSISVSDASVNNLYDRENIYSRLLLSSDLKGYVYNSAYYFENNDNAAKQALDNLMLTHGWSRFTWKKILEKETSTTTISNNYLITVTGSVLDAKDKRLVKGGVLNIFMEDEDSAASAFKIPVTPQGNFVIDSLLFNGKGRFYYVYTQESGKQKNVSLQIDKDTTKIDQTQLPLIWKEMVQDFPDADVSFLNQAYQLPKSSIDAKELEEVVLRSQQKRPSDMVNEKYATGFFKNMGKVVIDNVNQPTNNPNLGVVNFIEQTINTLRLQGQRFVNSKNFSMRNGQMWEVGLLLNEAPSTVPDIRSLTMGEIAFIKFYEAGFPGVSSSTPGGAIAIYTKKGGEAPKENVAGEQYFISNGYSVTKEFYHPDYSMPDTKSSVPDRRTTLYWNPAVFTSDDKSEFAFKFYNNDFSKKVKIVIEGIDSKGKLIHVEKIIEK